MYHGTVTESYYLGSHDRGGEVGHYHDGTEQPQHELSEWYVPFHRPCDVMFLSLSRNVINLEQVLFHNWVR